MTQSNGIHRFRKRYLAFAVVFSMLPSAYAMQELSDHSLSESTGEGVALVLDNFKMVMQAPNDLSASSSYNGISGPERPIRNAGETDSQYLQRIATYESSASYVAYKQNMSNASKDDTGFIRIIPTGENYNLYYDRVYETIYDETYKAQLEYAQATYYRNEYIINYDQKYAEYVKSTDALTMQTAFYQTSLTNMTTRYKDVYTALKQNEIFNNSNEKFSYKHGTTQRDNQTFKEYFDRRVRQYRWNIDSVVPDDGTTKYKGAHLNLEKANEYAWLNTIEMINKHRGTQITAYVNSRLQETTLAYVKSYAAEQADLYGTSLAINYIENYAKNSATAAAQADSASTLANSRTKADIFIYGLALSSSENDTDLNQRYSNKGLTWGTAENPWLFRAGNQEVSQFAVGNKKTIGYIALEAPLAKNIIKADGTIEKDTSDNNIKLGFWSDIFARPLESSREVDAITGAPTHNDNGQTGNEKIEYLDKNYRLRTQFVANGLSLNGSQVRLFQTLEEKPENPALSNLNPPIGTPPRSKDHFETLGIAALLRLNTNDDPSDIQYINENGLTSATLLEKQRLNAANLNGQAIRISTGELTNETSDTPVTPALKLGGLAPIFDPNEGLYLYSPNINLVLGNMNQPFVFGSEGNNIILEITRIPNVPEIYHATYQNYKNMNYGLKAGISENLGELDTAGKPKGQGSTCNVYTCGNEFITTTTPTPQYQGRNATHSSISIGTVERTSDNLLNAKRDSTATGIVFKDKNGIGTNLGSVAIDGVLIQHLKIKTTGL